MTNPSNTEIRERITHLESRTKGPMFLTPGMAIDVIAYCEILLNRLEAAEKSLRAHMKVLSTLRDKHGVSADLIGDIFDEEES